MKEQTKDPEQTKKRVMTMLEEAGEKIPPNFMPRFEEALAKVTAGNVTVKKALGITDSVMDALYEQGYNLFQNGKYKDALHVFNCLRFLDNTDSRFAFCIATCYYGMNDYINAAASYLTYRELDPFNPIVSFRIFDCFVKANNPAAALYFIQEALVLTDKFPKYASLKEKIKLEADNFNEFFKKYCKEKYESNEA